MNWQERAECRDEDRRWFFTEGDAFKVKYAKMVCRDCPVLQDCLEYALSFPDTRGVWGGTTTKERKKVRAQLSRAR